MRLGDAACIGDLAGMARKRLPGFAFDFLDGGAGDEAGMRRNCERLQAVLLKPRYARGVSPVTEAALFGRRYRLPIGVAPVGLGNLVWPGTDLALARLAHQAGIPFVLSTAATTSIEAVCEAAPGTTWFQLYVSRDDAITRDLLKRARNSGIEVLVVTIDIAAPGNRRRDARNGFSLPFRPGLRLAADLAARPRWSLATLLAGVPTFANLAPYAGRRVAGRTLPEFMADQIKAELCWEDVRQLRRQWPGTLVVKGVLAAEDAVAAREAGADAIWVSNHGGRQLDSAPAPIDALTGIRAAVGAEVPLLMDGGIRTGEDIVKARLMGADFAFSARCFYYGAAAGPSGGARALALLADDLRRTLVQIGCASFADLDRNWLWTH
jgi:(S)-mandelate dehydrogenase